MENLQRHIEALIFTAEQSITTKEIKSSIELAYTIELEDAKIQEEIESLKARYASADYAFELCEIADGYQFLSKSDYHLSVQQMIQQKAKKKLSNSALETLSIIAYKQPVTKSEIEYIRGVNCDYSIQKLLEKELVEIEGKSDAPGKPVLYGTSKNFMDFFGIGSVKDLPQLKDIQVEQNEIGEPTE